MKALEARQNLTGDATWQGLLLIELAELCADPDARVLTLGAKDRFVDYGTVGVAVTRGNTVELFVLSCRVLGLSVEPLFLDAVVRELEVRFAEVHGRFAATDRNQPARNLFRDQGFHEREPGLWTLRLADYRLALPACHAVASAGQSITIVSPACSEGTAPSNLRRKAAALCAL